MNALIKFLQVASLTIISSLHCSGQETGQLIESAKHVVESGNYIIAFRFDLERQSGQGSNPLRYFGKYNNNKDYDAQMLVSLVRREANLEKINEVYVKGKSLDPKQSIDFTTKWTEPFEVKFEKIDKVIAHPQIVHGSKDVEFTYYKMGSYKEIDAYLVILEATSIEAIKNAYILREGEIFLWNVAFPEF